MNTILFYIIIGIILCEYLLERYLEYLNNRQWSNVVPGELQGIYDPESYKRSQEYYRANVRLSAITSTFSLIIILLMLFLSGFARLDEWIGKVTVHPVASSLLFFGILFLAFDLIQIPFAVYDTFVIEQKFGFNRTTVSTFITDKIKGWLLAAIIGGALISLFVLFYEMTGTAFWIWAWIMVTGFMIIMNMFFSNLIVPLFNKQTPLEPGFLRDTIETYCTKTGVRLDNIFVIDGSKRSSKANAYFTGLGKKKRIVLFDTLIRDLETNEIVAVLAHETGHDKHKHTYVSLSAGILQAGLTLFFLSLFIDNQSLSAALGSDIASFRLGLIAFGILYSPLSTIMGLGMNFISRKHEYAADRFAAITWNADDLSQALKKLSVKNLSNLNPHPAYVIFHYSHPPLLQRIKAMKGINKKFFILL